jgi:excisionase family DNA binding protein
MVSLSEHAEPEKLLSAKKLARRLNVCLRTVYRMTARGELPLPQRNGPKQVGWIWEDVLDWIRQHDEQVRAAPKSTPPA